MKPVPADSLRRVLHQVFQDPAYRWVTPKDPSRFLRRWWDGVGDWFDRISDAHPALGYAIIVALLAVLALVLVHGAFIVVGTLRRAAQADQALAPVKLVERRDVAWHRRESERLSRAGRYTEALMEEFWALIAELESRRLVKFHPSKTPGEYALEPGLGPRERSELGSLVNRLYALVFAGRGCRAEDVAAWRSSALRQWGAGAG